MRNIFCFAIIFIGVLSSYGQTCEIKVVPMPNSVQCGRGEFTLVPSTAVITSDAVGKDSARTLGQLLNEVGLPLKGSSKVAREGRAIVFETYRFKDVIGAYELVVTPEKVTVKGDDVGQFYGIQTLVQLIQESNGRFSIGAVSIKDKPRFQYRGMHLDVGRHFFPVSFVKKYIDLMSRYKFNYFHWHLTEDQGWRIEIKKWPKLTQVGSRREETVKGRILNPYNGDGIPVEGYYTQNDVREVVAYAKARKITVVPEIELPGHSSAALAAYPQFACKKDWTYKVQTTWGIFKEVYCPTEETFSFLQDVIDEVVGLFPDSPYIHIGGDEVLKDHWKESPYVQELMKREGLKDEHEVQSYFIRRMEKYINSKGKRIIGWDEILEGGLAPNATVMSWRGIKGGIEAAKSGHDVIMTPTNYLYFDYGQGDSRYEPINIGNQLDVEAVYSYDPVPSELTAEESKYVLGAQGNVWTEYMKTPDKVEYMAFPRALALAEVVWTDVKQKDFGSFSRRLTSQFSNLDRLNVSYRIPRPDGLNNRILGAGEETVFNLTPAVPSWSIRYRVKRSEGEDPAWKTYDAPFSVKPDDGQGVEVQVMVFNGSRSSSVFAASVWAGSPPKGVRFDSPKSGVRIHMLTRGGSGVNAPDVGASAYSFESNSIQLTQFTSRSNNFSNAFDVSMNGFLCTPKSDIYSFQIESNGPTLLTVGGRNVVASDGRLRELVPIFGDTALGEGCHLLTLTHGYLGGEPLLNLRWGVKGTGLRRIYGSELVK